MSEPVPFEGFPGIGKATAVPNTFYSAVLPAMREPGDLLAFLWVARLVQEQQGDARFVTADQVWALPDAASTFDALTAGRDSLDRGLAACVELGALLALDLAGGGHQETVYFVNNPASRRAVARARGGDLELRPGAIAYEPPPAPPPQYLPSLRGAHRHDHTACRRTPARRRRTVSATPDRIRLPRGRRA